MRELKIFVPEWLQISQIINQFGPDTLMMTRAMVELEAIVKENKKPSCQQFSLQNYKTIMEIISTTVRRHAGVPLTTFAAACHPSNQKQSRSSNSNQPSTRRKAPPKGKNIAGYVREMRKMTSDDGKCGYCEISGHSANECFHLRLDLRPKSWKPWKTLWAYKPKENASNFSRKDKTNDSNQVNASTKKTESPYVAFDDNHGYIGASVTIPNEWENPVKTDET